MDGQTVTNYKTSDVVTCEKLLDVLIGASSCSRSIKEAVRRREWAYALHREIFGAVACTPTGRVRGQCDYTNSKNAPFQGLAADGVKLAMWDLVRSGYDVIAFIHDELLTEVDEPDDAQKVITVMKDRMEEVLGNCVPVEVEYSVGKNWEK